MRCSCFLLRSFLDFGDSHDNYRGAVYPLQCIYGISSIARLERARKFHRQGAVRRGEARRSELTFIEFFQSALTFIRKMYIYTPKSKINMVGVYIFTFFPICLFITLSATFSRKT